MCVSDCVSLVQQSPCAQALMAKSRLVSNPWDRAATLTRICWNNWARMIAATRLAIASPCWWTNRPATRCWLRVRPLANGRLLMQLGLGGVFFLTFWHVSSKLLGRSGAISSGKSLHPGHPGGHRSNCGSTQRCPEGQAERQCAEVRSLSFAKAWRWRALQKQPDLPAAPVRSPRGLFP